MLRWMTALLIVCCALSAAWSEDDQEQRLINGESRWRFAKQIKPLAAGIAQAKAVLVYEGLPHQNAERAALQQELKNKQTVQFHGFPFYEQAIGIEKEDAKKLLVLCGDRKTFGRYKGPKFCGGFHPDWCLTFQAGDDLYRVLICFGCHEARLYGPKNDVFSDLDDETVKKFAAILQPLGKHRPKDSAKQ